MECEPMKGDRKGDRATKYRKPGIYKYLGSNMTNCEMSYNLNNNIYQRNRNK
jgi:hypothetical protein